jgi:hypothetical protein
MGEIYAVKQPLSNGENSISIISDPRTYFNQI